jgi:hypothetical protein
MGCYESDRQLLPRYFLLLILIHCIKSRFIIALTWNWWLPVVSPGCLLCSSRDLFYLTALIEGPLLRVCHGKILSKS